MRQTWHNSLDFASHHTSRRGSKPRVKRLALLPERLNRRSLEWRLRRRLGAVDSCTRRIHVGWQEQREVTMSLAALFGFGSVIFIIVMTGAFVYGMTSLRAAADRDNYRPGTTKS